MVVAVEWMGRTAIRRGSSWSLSNGSTVSSFERAMFFVFQSPTTPGRPWVEHRSGSR